MTAPEIQSNFTLANKTAIVTGASSGIGARQAQALATAGASVVAVGRRAAALEKTVELIRSVNGQADFISADLSDLDSLPEIAEQAIAIHGKVDILVNAAGVNFRESVDDISIKSWQQTLELNLAVPFFLARECVSNMKHRSWGRILNIASLQSTRAFANGLAYGASKGGILQLTRAMAEAWSANGINCNAIAPGFFPTELTAPVFNDQNMTTRLAAQTTIGRNGKLDDLDGVTVFLCSDAAAYITGQTLNVDGGFTAK